MISAISNYLIFGLAHNQQRTTKESRDYNYTIYHVYPLNQKISAAKTDTTPTQPSTQPLTHAIVAQASVSSLSSSSLVCNPVRYIFVHIVTTDSDHFFTNNLFVFYAITKSFC